MAVRVRFELSHISEPSQVTDSANRQNRSFRQTEVHGRYTAALGKPCRGVTSRLTAHSRPPRSTQVAEHQIDSPQAPNDGQFADGKTAQETGLAEGQRYSPYKVFLCAPVPLSLLRCRAITEGAKLLFGYLTLYSGENGLCYPFADAMPVLG